MAYRYTRRLRLTKTDEFSSVFSFRTCRSNDYFQAFLLPNTLGHARLGVVVPKRIEKRAVHRNYIKRLVRESFRLHQASLPAHDLIIRAKRTFRRADGPAARAALASLFERVNKWRAS